MGRERGDARRGTARQKRWVLGAAALVALALAGPAQAAKSGGGMVDGTLTFSPGIAPLGPNCQVSTISSPPPPSGLSSQAFALDTQIVGYAGPVTIQMLGQTGCETLSGGSGSLRAKLTGFNQLNSARIDCPSAAGQYLEGGYIRTFSQLRVRLAGPCTINAFGTSNVSFVGELEFIPNGIEQGAGRTTPVTSAQVRGPFAITPG